MTPLEFFQNQQHKARIMDPEKIVHTLDRPDCLVTFLLAINDGFRSLVGYCLSVDGVLVVLKDETPMGD